jgi:predicted site-specific integrase-resolvase
MDTRKLMTEREVVERYGLPARTLQGWRHKGGGPRYVKPTSRVYYREEDIEAFLAASTRSHTAEAR